MGRFSVQLAPLFADFAGVAAGLARARRRRGHRRTDGRARAARRERRGSRSVAAVRRRAACALSRMSTRARRRAEELPWPDASFDAALAQLVISFMRTRRPASPRCAASSSPAASSPSCMWDREGMELLHAINQVQAVVDPGRSADSVRASATPTRSRSCSATGPRSSCSRSRPVRRLRRVLVYAHRRRRTGGRLGRVARRRPARRRRVKSLRGVLGDPERRLLADRQSLGGPGRARMPSTTFSGSSDAYERFMGRYSRPLARSFADFAGVRAGMRVLDVGAGTGALTDELIARVGTATSPRSSPRPTTPRRSASASPSSTCGRRGRRSCPGKTALSTARCPSSSCSFSRMRPPARASSAACSATAASARAACGSSTVSR